MTKNWNTRLLRRSWRFFFYIG